MPRHIEQPARRHSNPASRKTRSRPSASACRRTDAEPGTTSALTRAVDRAAGDDRGRRAQVLDPRVRAGADEHAVDRDVLDPLARAQVHVRERALDSGAVVRRVVRRRVGHAAGDRHDHPGVRAPRDLRDEVVDVDHDVRVVRRARVGGERAPVARRPFPSPPPGERAADPRGRRTSCRPARPSRRGHPTRSTCCRPSSAAPSRARGSPRRRTRRRTRRPRRHRPRRSRRGSGPWRSAPRGARRGSRAASSSASAGAASAWRGRARPRTCRSRTRAPRMPRGSRCGCPRRRSASRAA